MDNYRAVADLIKEKGHVVAFTGSGISVDSGIPTFRGGQGLWEKYDPMEYAHIDAFRRNPEKVWNMLREMAGVIFAAKPSPAHVALSELEKKGFLKAVITQNVDGLHQTAGNSNVIEYHGNHRRLVCVGCSAKVDFTEAEARMLPYPLCERCFSPLKPDVVFFGEPIPMLDMIRANEEAKKCNVMLIMGTSGVVYPAADLPYLAHSSGAKVVEINIDDTPFTSSISDFVFRQNASIVLPKILEYIGT
jgi:NAD-dependent protein deacetylase/lipoamidase